MTPTRPRLLRDDGLDLAERRALERILARLEEAGFLLFSDAERPSVVTLVAGAPVRGSWWGHPAGGRIYRVGEALEKHPDVLAIPLLFRKATLVHRRLWPEVLAVARSREEWQTSGLSPAGRGLLQGVEHAGELRLDSVPPPPLAPGRTMGDVARDLERRLLVLGRSEHSETGRHVKRLVSWDRWKEERGVRGRLPTPSTGRVRLEASAQDAIPGGPERRRFPWSG